MKLIQDALLASCFGLLILFGFKFIFAVNIGALNTFKALSSKIDYTDLYYSKFYVNETKDAKITLVNIADGSKNEIANLISTICQQNPMVLGVDISFSKKSTPQIDSLLKASIKKCEKIVFPINGNQKLSSDPELSTQSYFGSNNLITDKNGVVKYVNLKDKEVEHFTLKIAQLAQPLKKYFDQTQEINYFGDHNNFYHYEPSEILSDSNGLLANKIVLLGYAGPEWGNVSCVEDSHFTPLDINTNRLKLAPTAGMVIHANILRNIIREDFTKYAPGKINYLLIFLLLLIFNLFYLGNFKRLSISFFLKFRLFQLIVVTMVAYGIFYLFHNYRIKMALAEWMLAIIASFELSVLYAYLMNNLGNKFGIKSYIHDRIQEE